MDALSCARSEPAAVTVRLARGPGYTWDEAQVVECLRTKIDDEVIGTVTWGAPEPSRSDKLLIIRNDWLAGQRPATA